MGDLPTLRRELIGAFAIVFAGALFVAVTGVVLVVGRFAPAPAAAYVVTLLLADVALFSWFGAFMLRRRLLRPLDRIMQDVEAISSGELERRLPQSETREMARLSAAVNQMAERLIEDRHRLAENIRSLDETNRLLTEARDAMVRTEKMATVGRLGAGIAHEVGNPLGAILGYMSLLRRGAGDAQRELVDAAEREAQRIDRIVRGLLDYSRPRETVAQPVDVNAVLRDTIELIATQGQFTRVHVRYEPGSDTLVRGDPYQLQQVFVNLIVNAAQAMDGTDGAELTIVSVRRPVESVAPHTPARRKGDPVGIDYSHRRRLAMSPRWPVGDPDSDSGEIVEVSVSDNGPGIPVDLLDQVFEPFVTTKEPGKGTGLGLAVCARIIEGMGGAIRADNNEDGGAVFRLLLPAIPAEVTVS